MAKIVTLEVGTVENHNALESLGLKVEWLQLICLRALAAFNQTSPYDAASAPGSYAYFAAVRAKREILCPEGWQMLRKNGLEITKNPINSTSIIVSSGDEYIGIKNKVPGTKNPKGKQTYMVVCQNQRQLTFWAEYAEKEENTQLGPTWILLYHIDIKKGELRMELSLPVEMNTDELKISGWNTRIILPSINYSEPILEFESKMDSENDFEPEITIVRRDEDE